MSALLTVVLDTSVWVSGVFFRGTPYRVLRAWRDHHFDVVYTLEVLQEIADTLRSKALAFGAAEADALEWVAYIRAFARNVAASGAGAGVCRDPRDDKFLDAAITARATYLVSGDRDLLDLGEVQGVKIVSPQQFLAILGSSASDRH